MCPYIPTTKDLWVFGQNYKFAGTPAITGLMLLAVTYLLVWDLRILQFLFHDNVRVEGTSLKVIDNTYWTWLGLIMVFTIFGFAVFYPNLILELGIPFLEGLIGFIVFFTVVKRSPQKT